MADGGTSKTGEAGGHPVISSSAIEPVSAALIGVESSVPCADAANRPRALTVIRREGGVALIPPPGGGATLSPDATCMLIEALRRTLPHAGDVAEHLIQAGA